jgi:citrate synthase
MTDAKTDPWPTAITAIEPNDVRVRGYDIAELMGRLSFGGMVYLILRGERPDPSVARLMDAIVGAGIDHGATPPSALAARTVASTGASLSASVAAGILAVNRHHGGAVEGCARVLGEVVAAIASGQTPADAAASVIDDHKAAGRRIPGFGHRVHTADPRTARLFALAAEAGADGPACAAARALEQAFADRGKPLPINVDGAMGAVLADLGFEPEVMNGLFIIGRCAGLVAHAREEQTRMRPMRRIDPVNHAYDGPPPRSFE